MLLGPFREAAGSASSRSRRLLTVSAEYLGPERHAVLIMDGAGWHVTNDLLVWENVTLLLLPPYSPYSPELNSVE